jgi:hypothetical protein
MLRLGRFGLLIALFGALALVPHGRVYAAPPPPQGFTCQSTGSGSVCHGDFTYYNQSFVLANCGSGGNAFDAVLTWTTYQDVTAYFNEVGMIVGLEFHFKYVDSALVNSVTGTTIPVQNNNENDSFTFTYDSSGNLVAVTRAQSGSIIQITLPGYGVVAHVDGLGVFNDFTGQLIKGDHPQVVGAIDSTDICTALA